MESQHKPILLIDDSEDIRDVFGMWMEMEGYTTKTAGTAVEGMELLRAGLEPCLILVDLNMPKMDGEEFIRKVKAEKLVDGAPIYVFSAARVSREIEGSAGWIAKPVDLQQVLGILKNLDAPCSMT